MQIVKRKILILSSLLILILAQFLALNFISQSCLAAGDLWGEQVGRDEIGEKFGESGTPRDIRQIIAYVIKAFLGFMAIIFLVLILTAGYKYMMAAGNEDQVKEAVSQIKNAVIGLFIILASYAITSYVIDCILDITSGPSMWQCSQGPDTRYHY